MSIDWLTTLIIEFNNVQEKVQFIGIIRNQRLFLIKHESACYSLHMLKTSTYEAVDIFRLFLISTSTWVCLLSTETWPFFLKNFGLTLTDRKGKIESLEVAIAYFVTNRNILLVKTGRINNKKWTGLCLTLPNTERTSGILYYYSSEVRYRILQNALRPTLPETMQ